MLNHMAKEIQTLIYSLYLFRFAPCLSVNSNGFQYFLITIQLRVDYYFLSKEIVFASVKLPNKAKNTE